MIQTKNKTNKTNDYSDEFIQIVNHELKSPLATIKIFVELLEKQLGSSDNKTKGSLEKINYKVDRLTYLINDYTDLVKLQANDLVLKNEKLIFEDLVTKSLECFHKSFKTTQIEMIGKTEKIVDIDPARFNQVLFNIIFYLEKNAGEGRKTVINVSSFGKEVVMNIRNIDCDSEMFEDTVLTPDDLVPAESHKKQLNQGIGLMLAKGLMERFKGRLEINKVNGDDLVVCMTLPISV